MRSSPSSDSGMAFPVLDPPIQVLNRHTGKQSQCTWKMAAHEPGRGKHHRSGAWLQDASPPYRGLSKGAEDVESPGRGYEASTTDALPACASALATQNRQGSGAASGSVHPCFESSQAGGSCEPAAGENRSRREDHRNGGAQRWHGRGHLGSRDHSSRGPGAQGIDDSPGGSSQSSLQTYSLSGSPVA